ncbi:embryonic stem cell-specific5-hydroxymethylcytosine-binding protein [Striga asiatica]|uniref:Embryonic stem cell-specific5-hydroxymethylcytosine-binding protein n=1 Tax=Striga asiatica TaxID=4170 RepID=A0A5A7RAT0_STRAF|nr:embryonic stem cell-specific5-hydroxymethylcytosine-binding protein [Striga asiatica]
MPVILGNKESTENWLNDTSLSNLDKILKPYEGEDLAWYPVTTAMGKLSFDGPECIKEIQVKTEETKTISQFFSKKDMCAPEPKREKSPVKNEPTEASEPNITKEESYNLPTENTTIMYEPAESSLQKSVKYEDENQSALKITQVKDECVENSQEKSTKEEPESQGKDDQSTITKDNLDKRDYAKFCAHAKESEKKHVSPARKRNKDVADDKQPTLFSYFGRR